MSKLRVDEALVRRAFLAALEGGTKIHRKTLVKLIADQGALDPAGPTGRTAHDYAPLGRLLGEMILEGLIDQTRALMCSLNTEKS